MVSIAYGVTAPERQTVVRKTLKISVKFGVAAPRPLEKYRNINQNAEGRIHRRK